MQLMKQESKIDFLGMSRFWIIFSIIVIVLSLSSFIVRGFNYGIDFTGGTAINIKFEANADASADKIRDALSKINMESASVQNYGEKDAHEFLIKVGLGNLELNKYESEFKKSIDAVFAGKNSVKSIKFSSNKAYVTLEKPGDSQLIKKGIEDLKIPNLKLRFVELYGKESNQEYLAEFLDVSQSVNDALAGIFPAGTFSIIKVDNVGKKVGKELRRDAILASFIALFFILLYIWLRFELEFAPGAVICLIHDAIITAGVFSLFGFEIDTTFVAAILTIVGYSINDTIVVYDRIRENLVVLKSDPFKKIINRSINQTLSRTLLTSLTTLLVTVVVLFFGGPILFNMALALTIGVVIGSYSTIFIASPLTLYLYEKVFSKKMS